MRQAPQKLICSICKKNNIELISSCGCFYCDKCYKDLFLAFIFSNKCVNCNSELNYSTPLYLNSNPSDYPLKRINQIILYKAVFKMINEKPQKILTKKRNYNQLIKPTKYTQNAVQISLQKRFKMH